MCGNSEHTHTQPNGFSIWISNSYTMCITIIFLRLLKRVRLLVMHSLHYCVRCFFLNIINTLQCESIHFCFARGASRVVAQEQNDRQAPSFVSNPIASGYLLPHSERAISIYFLWSAFPFHFSIAAGKNFYTTFFRRPNRYYYALHKITRFFCKWWRCFFNHFFAYLCILVADKKRRSQHFHL